MAKDPDHAFYASGSRPPPSAAAVPHVSGKLSAEDLIALNDEIAGMARAGLPLDQGLAVLAKEMGRGRLQKVTRQLATDLSAGLTLPQALERQEGRVPPYYATLLTAGIRSGRIGQVLSTLTLYARSLADFREAVTSALIYPVIVLLLGLGILVFVGALVLPMFVEVFEKMRLTLPAVTKFLLFIGAHPWETLIVPVAILLIAPLLIRWCLLRSPRGRVLWTRFIYSLPIAGTLVRSARLAAFCDLLGILVDQSVPLPEAMQLAAGASSDPLLQEGIGQVTAELAQGTALGEALQRKRLVPELVIWMTRFGEKQGTLGMALHNVAQMYRRQADIRVTLLRTVLPPFLILCLAMLLGSLFIFGILSPMQRLFERMGGSSL